MVTLVQRCLGFSREPSQARQKKKRPDQAEPKMMAFSGLGFGFGWVRWDSKAGNRGFPSRRHYDGGLVEYSAGMTVPVCHLYEAMA